jgi:hypothetical protein
MHRKKTTGRMRFERECSMHFGNSCAVKRLHFLSGPTAMSVHPSLLQMHSLLPLSYFFIKERISSFWAVFKVESFNWRQ